MSLPSVAVGGTTMNKVHSPNTTPVAATQPTRDVRVPSVTDSEAVAAANTVLRVLEVYGEYIRVKDGAVFIFQQPGLKVFCEIGRTAAWLNVHGRIAVLRIAPKGVGEITVIAGKHVVLGVRWRHGSIETAVVKPGDWEQTIHALDPAQKGLSHV